MASKKFSSRTKARFRAVDVLFEAQIKGLDDPAGIFGLTQERQVVSTAQTTIPAYSVEILEGVCDHLERIDTTLQTYSRNWQLNRMPTLDLAILRVGCWEILYKKDMDGKVAIAEAIKIARENSTAESPKFIGGLLGQINDLRSTLQTTETVMSDIDLESADKTDN